MRVACLLVTHLRAKVEMYRHSHLKDAPVVIVNRSPSRARPVVGKLMGMALSPWGWLGIAVVAAPPEPAVRRDQEDVF